jgi:hypothetical protein
MLSTSHVWAQSPNITGKCRINRGYSKQRIRQCYRGTPHYLKREMACNIARNQQIGVQTERERKKHKHQAQRNYGRTGANRRRKAITRDAGALANLKEHKIACSKSKHTVLYVVRRELSMWHIEQGAEMRSQWPGAITLRKRSKIRLRVFFPRSLWDSVPDLSSPE